MAKKIIFGLALALIVASGVFAQEGKSASAKRNWISGEVSLLGAGARYEFMLNDKWSIGANAYWSTFFIIWNELGVDASVRFYPRGNIFFVGTGLGFHIHTGTYSYRTSGGGHLHLVWGRYRRGDYPGSGLEN